MRQTRSVEIGTGLFVLLGMSSLFFLTTQTTGGDDFQAESIYTVEARFENIGSLRERAPVTMSGVTIGRVTDVAFDPVSASILTSGILSSQYVGLQAGGSDMYLEDGSEILFTQSAIVLENLIGKFLVNAGSNNDD